jgi:autotransporter-associated beta strand protein
MSLLADSRLVASGAGAVITAQSTIDATSSGAQSLTVNATGAGSRVALNAAVGGIAKLSNLSVAASAITMKAGSVQTGAGQSYVGAMSLGDQLLLSAANPNADIVLGGTVDSDVTPRSLTVAAGGGNTGLILKGSVGATRPLSSFIDLAARTQVGDSATHTPITLKTLSDLQFKQSLELQANTQFHVAALGSIEGVISGNFSVLKEGAGILSISSDNRFSADTWVNAGTLSLLHARALGASPSAVTVANGATLDLQGVTVVGKELKLQGGTLSASQGSSAWTGRVKLDADSRFDVTATQLNVSGAVDSVSSGAGLLLSGTGSVTLSHVGNTLSRLASTATVSSVDIKNSSPLRIGSVAWGATSFNNLQSTGAITLSSTDAVTVPTSAALISTGGPIVVETSRFLNQAGATALTVPTGKAWQIWSTNATPFDATRGDSLNTLDNDYVHYNVSRASAMNVPDGKGLLYSYAPVATATLTGAVSKVYDATSSARLQPNNYAVTGPVSLDVLTLTTPLTGTYVSAGSGSSPSGAGVQKDVQVTNVGLTAQQAGKPVYGYNFASTITGAVGDIQPKLLDAVWTKVYEGSPLFDARNTYVLTGMIGNEGSPQIIGGQMSLASSHVGTYNQFVSSSLSLNNPNYTLVGGGQLATIQKAPLGIAVNLQSKGKAEFTDIAAKDFTVVGLQNGEVIPKIDALTMFYKEVNRNDDNYVVSIAVSPGPGVADPSNYAIHQAVNRSVGTGSMNIVKLTAPDEVILIPALPRPYLPEVSKAELIPVPVAGLRAPASTALTTVAASPNAGPGNPVTSTTPNTPVAVTSTTGIVVSTVSAPGPQTSGLVTVVVPRDLSGPAATGLVIGLPQSVVATASLSSGEAPELKVTLSNNQPLPDWIRFDASQKTLVTTPDARATFPISVSITVGDQRTVVVISESTQN